MKLDLLKLFFLAICFVFLSFNYIDAQENIELVEIKGSDSLVYQEFKIEISGIKRLKEYQPVWRESGRPRGHKIVAEPGSEIALVQLKAKKLGRKSGISISNLYLRDSKRMQYEAQTRAFFIGANNESKIDSKNDVYEFPVMIPKGTRLTAVQLWQFTVKEIQPLTVQKITFDVSQFDW